VIFLQYFIARRIRHIHHAVGVFIRKRQAGIAEVIFYRVLIAQGICARSAGVGVEYPAFS
jgi:hypothetical protein